MQHGGENWGGGMKNRKTNESRLAVLPSCKMTQTAEGNREREREREREASSKAVDRQSIEKSIFKNKPKPFSSKTSET